MQLEVLKNKVKFEWGLGCFEIAAELLDVDSADDVILKALGGTAQMSRVAYAAIQNFYELDNESIPFTIRQFQKWLDEQPEETGVNILNDFLASTYQGKVMKDRYEEIAELFKKIQDEEEEKKKPVKKKRASAK